MKQLITFIFILSFSSSVISQAYFNELLLDVTHKNILIKKLYTQGDHFIIPYDYVSNAGTRSAIIKTNMTSFEEYFHDNMNLGATPMILIDNTPYIAGSNSIYNNKVAIGKLSEDLSQQIWFKEYDTPGYFTSNTRFSFLEHLYLLNINLIDPEDNLKRSLQLIKIDTMGHQLWSKNYGDHARYNSTWDMRVSKDNNLFISHSLAYPQPGSLSTRLLKVDTDGEIIWDFESIQPLDGGAAPIWITELSDSSIVQCYEVDMILADVGWDWMTWARTPYRLRWIDKYGNPKHQTLLKTKKGDDLYITHIEAGKGDYFYTYGNFEDGQADEYYGIISKYANNGDTIWIHKYQYPEWEDIQSIPTVIDIIELDNGDIVALGTLQPLGGSVEIWLFKVNEFGCFGGVDCGEFTSTSTLSQSDHMLQVYPNPTSDILCIELEDGNIIENIIIYNSLGTKAFQSSTNSNNTSIPVNDWTPGVYFVFVQNNEGHFAKQKVIIE